MLSTVTPLTVLFLSVIYGLRTYWSRNIHSTIAISNCVMTSINYEISTTVKTQTTFRRDELQDMKVVIMLKLLVNFTTHPYTHPHTKYWCSVLLRTLKDGRRIYCIGPAQCTRSAEDYYTQGRNTLRQDSNL